MKLNPTITQSKIVSRSRSDKPSHSSILLRGTKRLLFGAKLDKKLTFEKLSQFSRRLEYFEKTEELLVGAKL